MRAVLVLAVMLVAARASAQCRAPDAIDATERASWTHVADGIDVGRCEPDGDFCLSVGARTCMLDLGLAHDAGIESTLLDASGTRLIVLRWSDEHGGGVSHVACGVEVWTTEPMPRRLLWAYESVEDYVNDDSEDSPPLCVLTHAITIDALGVAIAARHVEGGCGALVAVERIGTQRVPARGGRWTWASLLARPRR